MARLHCLGVHWMTDSDLAPALAVRSDAVTGILCVSVGCAHPLQQMLGSDHWVVLTSQEAAKLCSEAVVSPTVHKGFTPSSQSLDIDWFPPPPPILAVLLSMK